MQFRILGPLEVEDAGRPVAVGAGKQRALLAILLLHANDVVPADRLIDQLWAETIPDSARKAIQVYVSRLRKALGADRIRTSGQGYRLEVGADELDLDRFERVVARGRELRDHGEPALASATLKEALALWHGSPLVDLAHEPFAQAEIARLEGLRLAAIEERMDADLARGLGAELVGELEALVVQHPYRERLRGQLMLALYRAGRQADALAAYHSARRLFVDELGIEPSPALQRLEQAILRQEPELEALLEAVDQELPARAESPPDRATTRRYTILALAGVALVTAVLAVGIGRAKEQHFLPRLDAYTVGVVDPGKGRIEEQLAVGGLSNGVASGGGHVWLAGADGGTITRIGLDRHSILRATIGASADGIAYGAHSLWVTNSEERALVQVEPARLGKVQQFTVGNGPRAVAVGNGAVWVANTIDGTVSRIDLARGTVGDPIPVGPDPEGIAVGGGGVWVVAGGTGTVVRIDPATSEIVQPITVGNGPAAIAYGAGAVWVANRDDGTVSRINAATNAVTATITVGSKPAALAATDDAVWVANSGDGTIIRIDPRTALVNGTFGLGSNPNGLAVAAGKLWTTTVTRGGHRGGVLRVELSSPRAAAVSTPSSGPM